MSLKSSREAIHSRNSTSRAVYLHYSLLIPQMWSGLPKYMRTSAHDSWQVLTFEGKTCSLGRSFTTLRVYE